MNATLFSFYEKLGMARRAGIKSISQLRAILHLGEFGPMNVRQLIPATGISTAAMTGLLDVLTQKGFIEAAATPDRRQRLVQLTPKGKKLVDQLNG